MKNLSLVRYINVLSSPELCDRLFSIVTLMNLGNIWFVIKGFSRYSLVVMNRMRWHYCTLRSKNTNFVENKRKAKITKETPKKKVSMEI